jgi:hypothetical protein
MTMIPVMDIPTLESEKIPVHKQIYNVIQNSHHLDCWMINDSPFELGQYLGTQEGIVLVLGKTSPQPSLWQIIRNKEPEGLRSVLGRFWIREIKGNFVPFYISTTRVMPEAQAAMEWLKSQFPQLDIRIGLSRQSGGSGLLSALPPSCDY